MIENLESLYQRLNSSQREAVLNTEGPVMVLAGPGTGKTQVLASRIAHILENPDLQMNPENILCLTFTESGVVAMRNRLISFIGAAAYYVKIHTFHSFSNELIQDNAEIFPKLSSIAELEQIEIMERLISNLDADSPLKPFADPLMYRNEALSLIKLLKREAVSTEDFKASIEFIELLKSLIDDLVKDFISKNARSLKDEDCIVFIDELAKLLKNTDLKTHLANKSLSEADAKGKILQFIIQIRKFFTESTKVADFKNNLKDFYTKAIDAIPKQFELLKLYKAYLSELKEKKLYDFEDMLLMVISAFRRHPDLLASYKERFQYLLVDEYQDTNGSQNKILSLLSSFYQDQANIFVVGDDDQSIYKFQGASLENVSSFFRTYEKTLKLVVLSDNYRSQQNILDLSYHLVSHNKNQIQELFPNLEKKLSATNQNLDLEPVKILAHTDFNSELFFITEEIKKLLDRGVKANEIAVLVRNNKDVTAIADLLSRSQIQVKVYSNQNILEDILIAQLIDLLRLISDPKAHSYLIFNILHYDFIIKANLNQENADAERDIAKQINKISKLREIWELQKLNRDSEESLIEIMLKSEVFKGFAEKILSFYQLSSNCFLDKLFEDIIHEFNFLNFILEDVKKIENLQNLNQLFAEIKDLQLNHKHQVTQTQQNNSESLVPIYKLKDFLSHLERLKKNRLKLNAASMEDLSLAAVQIMTAHKSKGLEFEYVFIHKCVDKTWGNTVSRAKLRIPPFTIGESVSETKESQNDEERRLFFVAMTRAKKEVYINYYKKDANAKDVSPSLFVEELLEFKDKSKIAFIETDSENSLKLNNLLDKNLAFLNSHKLSNYNEEAVLEAILAEYKLSVTHLNTFLKCPRKFLLQHLLRVPAAKNKSASFGTAVHAALYETFKLIKKKDLDHKAFLLNSFSENLKKEYLNDTDYTDALNLGLASLGEYFDEYKDSFIEDVELEFNHKSLEYKGLNLTGKLDKIEILDSVTKAVNVVDYKTGNPSYADSKLKAGADYHRQIAFYQLLMDLAFEAGTCSYRMLSGEIDFVQTDKDKKFKKAKIYILKEDLENLDKEIMFFKEKLLNRDFSLTDDVKNCTECQFRNLCCR